MSRPIGQGMVMNIQYRPPRSVHYTSSVSLFEVNKVLSFIREIYLYNVLKTWRL